MTRLLLDTNILLEICHPRKYPQTKTWLQGWLRRALEDGEVEVTISAAADYELRRGYTYKLKKLDALADTTVALQRLDELCANLPVSAIANDTLRRAAEFWADARRGGYQTAGDREIDWDVIIASQAAELGAIVVTRNTKHFSRYGIEAKTCEEAPAHTSQQ